MNVYIDTNILVDFVCRREAFFEDARTLFAYGYSGVFSLQTSAISFVNTMYIAHKYDYHNVTESLIKLADFVDVVDLKGESAVWALTSNWKDYEDDTQYKSAISCKADCIVTRNKKDFKLSSIPVYTVKELLETIKA
jgi:predicted nucleic acid-binding protein